MNYDNLILMDFEDNKVDTGVSLDPKNLNRINSIVIEVLTGDEIAYVRYSDGTSKKFDSCSTRRKDYKDGLYTLYDRRDGINLIPQFLKRENSYWIWLNCEDSEKD